MSAEAPTGCSLLQLPLFRTGVLRALVKSCKRALEKSIEEQVLSPVELYTCLLEVGNLVNQRPIGPVPNDRMMANIYV